MQKKIIIKSEFEVYSSVTELAPGDRKLHDAAVQAAQKAYAPYSHFKVGAALVLENGEIVTGNNQENAAYPSGLCAERVAAFSAAARFPGMVIRSMAVVSINQPQHTIAPCGACRQVLAEYEIQLQQPIRMIMSSLSGEVFITNSVVSLLPFVFNRESLGF